MIRQARELVHGMDGVVVLVTGRAAAWLLRYAELDHYHASHRGEDPEIDQTLIALKVAALSWRESATGTKNAAAAELPTQLQWLSTKQAADALAMTDRAIRKAIRENRLKANRVGRAYRINREQLAHFKARKEPA
ncbi:excisionase family DNA-binding protein [Curtobacterium flaccumfaciens]|uniref:excisionase family DNA-binding protein n=1 Tax=Curtobacterium flaccumfaciens TaxID=2035 RepID=UPI0038793C40